MPCNGSGRQQEDGAEGPTHDVYRDVNVKERHRRRAAAQRRANLLARATGQFASIRPAPSAEAAGLIEQRREALLGALFELREEDRLVITYRYFFDFSEAETAEVLGVARGTVKSRLARALARFGPIVRRLGPLVVVGPSVESVLAPLLKELRLAPQLQARPELGSAVLQHLSVGATPGKAPSPLTEPAVITLAALTAVGLVVGALALSPRPQASPPVGTTPQVSPPVGTTPQANTPSRHSSNRTSSSFRLARRSDRGERTAATLAGFCGLAIQRARNMARSATANYVSRASTGWDSPFKVVHQDLLAS